MGSALDRELQAVLARLSGHERGQVLAYARWLQGARECRQADLRQFVGSISNEDLQLMREAIEEHDSVHVPGRG